MKSPLFRVTVSKIIIWAQRNSCGSIKWHCWVPVVYYVQWITKSIHKHFSHNVRIFVNVFPVNFFYISVWFHVNAVDLKEVANSTLLPENSYSSFVNVCLNDNALIPLSLTFCFIFLNGEFYVPIKHSNLTCVFWEFSPIKAIVWNWSRPKYFLWVSEDQNNSR